jgi:hypothetical protein
MATLMSKSAYARRHGRGASSVSNWIQRGQLTSPAVRADGRIDAELADQQLGLSLDTVQSATRAPTQPIETPTMTFSPTQQAQARLLNAKALDAAIKAETNRRALNAQRGRYTLTEEIRAEFGRGIMDHLMDVEQSLPDLAARLGLGREGLHELRKWWRDRRDYTAKRNRLEAENFPEFIADPERS